MAGNLNDHGIMGHIHYLAVKNVRNGEYRLAILSLSGDLDDHEFSRNG